jgi:hypothetical protein
MVSGEVKGKITTKRTKSGEIKVLGGAWQLVILSAQLPAIIKS